MTEAVADLARAQHGLVSHEQLSTVLGPGQLRAWRRNGRLEPMRRGVYRVSGAPPSWEQSVLAVCLAVPGATASFRCAAALWELEGFAAGAVEITVPGRQRTRLAGVTVHDSTVSGPIHRAVLRGIPTTSALAHSATSPRWSRSGSSSERSTRPFAAG